MRKQLEEIKELDSYILRQMDEGERLLMQAKMILSPKLKQNWWRQAKIHRLVRLFGREEKRVQLNTIYHRLMSDMDFNEQITSIFK